MADKINEEIKEEKISNEDAFFGAAIIACLILYVIVIAIVIVHLPTEFTFN